MLDQQTKVPEACEIKEKPHHLDKDQIISYLSLLERLYEKENKNNAKFDQKRMFLINKALNSVKKYSNVKVSPFRLNKSSLNKEEQKVKDKCDIAEEKENEETDINDIMCLIEKELKLNGIDVNDININDNSFLSTNQKSQNTDSNNNTANKKNDTNNNNSNSETKIPVDTHQKPQKRLSKLFLKIEMKLRTYLQEEKEKNFKTKLIGDKEKAIQTLNNTNNNKGLNLNFNKTNNDKLKLSKRPCKMPDLANSFFSNKKKVENMLSRAKKYKRKSMIQFNALFLLKPKKDKEDLYFEDSNDKNNRRKVATALLERPQKKKIIRNCGNEMISNFCGKIDEIVENKEECDEIIPFSKNVENLDKKKVNNEENMINQTPLFIDDNNSSIKITSTINKNKLDLAKLNKESQKHFSLFKNDPSDIILFNQDRESTLLDDNLFVQSSDKELTSGSKMEEDDEEEDSGSCSSDDCNEKEENKCENKKDEGNNKNDNSDSEDSNKKTSNFNFFYKNSIFSPLKDLQDNQGKEMNFNEHFNNLHL